MDLRWNPWAIDKQSCDLFDFNMFCSFIWNVVQWSKLPKDETDESHHGLYTLTFIIVWVSYLVGCCCFQVIYFMLGAVLLLEQNTASSVG